MYHPGLKEVHERYEQFLRGAALETIKIVDQYSNTRYAALPGASLWTRFKVWLKNRRLRA